MSTTQIEQKDAWWRDYAFQVTVFGFPPVVLIPVLIAAFFWSVTTLVVAVVAVAFFTVLNKFGYTPTTLWWVIRVRLGRRLVPVFPAIGKRTIRFKF